jgi:hypothetical protein
MEKASRTVAFFGEYLCLPNNMASAFTLSIVVDDSLPVSQDQYDNLPWYPGRAAVQRLKERYLRKHPEVRAHSSTTAEAVSDTEV